MAARAIRSTRERVNELRSIADQINLVIRGCQDTQKYCDRMVRDGWTQYEDIHKEVAEKMATLDEALVQAWLELGRLSNGAYAAKADLAAAGCGMTFQYVWQAGKCNVKQFHFATSDDSVYARDHTGNASATMFGTGSGTDGLVPVGHFIKVENAEDAFNDGIHAIDTDASPPGDDKMYVTSVTGFLDNTADTTAKITYWATS